MEAVNGVSDGDKGGPPPPSPLTGCYLLIVVGEPHCNEHKDIILQRVAKGLLSWDLTECLVDLEKELAIITEQALEGEEARFGERLIQFASENLVTEILIHPVVSTLAQCVRNLLSSFTRHRHIIHAGYTFANNGSWVLQDGTFSSTDFSEAFQEIEVLRVIRAYENGISLDLHCAPEGDWTRLPKEPFTKGCKVRVNSNDVLTAGSPSISSFINYLEPYLVPAELKNVLESSDVVGNIRFSRPTLYVFPGGQGDAALFGINGFNMLLDGGFSRKACFWDFVRHLDRLDAVLLTRLNNSNVNGISAVLKRKKQNALYPQIGHFFCNIQERKAILSPDGDKDKDPLLINLLEEGQEIVSNLRHLSLIPQVCYRDSEPINLYHKVGHGTLDMYVLSPAKDSKEVREFLQKWNNNDQKLFANQKTNKDFVFPLQNLVSICALLVWQPANPEDTITRILFPGSSPQNKIFEGLEKVKSLDFIKHPVCSEKSLAPATIIKAKQSLLDKIIPTEKKIPVDNKKEKPQKPARENGSDAEIKNGEVNGIQPSDKGVPVKKSDSTESEKSISKPKKIVENGEKIEKSKPKPKQEPKTKPRGESQQRKVKPAEKKPSPTTPKKQGDESLKPKAKASPTSTPAKSAKEATNRKVVESKIKSAPPKKEAARPPVEKKETKVERKPISRRPKDTSKVSGSPTKKVNGVQKPDSISKRGKLDKEGTTDSSTVSTPSAEQDTILKKDISKLTSDEIQNLKAQELADLKEEQEAVKEIEAVFRKGELQEDKPSDFRKIKDLSVDDKLENEEYLIIEKTEIEQDLVNETNQEETQKIARDSEESEKQRKLSAEKEADIEEKRNEIQEVPEIITSATEIVKEKEETVEASKEASVTSPEEKIDSTDKKDIEEVKEVAQESQPDEKGSANIESGATTTAPTLPEDERMPLDEIKEDNGDQIEEKHVKENTKEKDVPVIQLPPKTFDNITKLPPVVGIRLDKQSHMRDIVKTPDEVADLPVHEEVEFDHYDEYPSGTEIKSEPEDAGKEKAEIKDVPSKEKADKEIETKDAGVTLIKEKTDVDIRKETKTEEVIDEAVQPEVKAVISEDLNKKELSKSPDEEKDTDEHELEQKKEEAKDSILSSQNEIVKKEKPTVDEVAKAPSAVTDVKESEEVEAKEPVIVDTNEARELKDEQKDTIDQHKPDVKATEVEKVEIKEPVATETKDSKELQQDAVIDDLTVELKGSEAVETKESVTESKQAKELEDEQKDAIDKGKPSAITDDEKIETKHSVVTDNKQAEELKEDQDNSIAVKVELKEIEKVETRDPIVTDNKQVEEVKDDQKGTVDQDKLSTATDEPKDIEKVETKEPVVAETEHKAEIVKDTVKLETTEPVVTEVKHESGATDHNLKQESAIQEPVKVEEIIEKSETEIKEKDDAKEKTPSVELQQKERVEELSQQLPEVPKHEIVQTTEELKLEENASIIEDIEEDLQKQKDDTLEITEELKQDGITIEKTDDKLQELREDLEEKRLEEVSEIITHKVEEPLHAEPVIITADSVPDTPETDQKRFEDKLELGSKSPKEREEDVAKIVASVAEVLKSDAPLEEFEGKLPFTIPYKSYTTELRETHITTVESPVTDENKIVTAAQETICPKISSSFLIEEERKIAPIHEEPEIPESKVNKMIKDSNELMQATSKIINDIKTQAKTDAIPEELDSDNGTVHRMLVTASSEDGGEETEICPPGTITFSKSSESSGRSSPEPNSQKLSQKSSIADTCSEATVLTKSGATEQSEEVTKIVCPIKDDVEDSKLVIEKAICDSNDLVIEVVDQVKLDAVEQTEGAKESESAGHKDVPSGLDKAQVETATDDKGDTAKTALKPEFDELPSEKEKTVESLDQKEEITKSDEKEIPAPKDTIAENIDKEAGLALAAIEEVKDEANKQLDTITKEVEQKKSFVGELVNDIGASLLHDTTKLIEKAQQQVNEIQESAKSQIDGLKEDITTKKEELVKDTKETIAESVSDGITKEKEAVTEATKSMVDTEDDTVIKEKEELEETVQGLQAMVSKAEGVIGKVKEEIASAEKTIDKQIKDVQEILAAQTQVASEVVTDFKDSITKDIETKVAEIKEKVEETKVDLKKDTEATIAQREDVELQTKKEVETKVETVLQDISDKKDTIIKSVGEEMKRVEEQLEGKKEQVAEKLETLSNDLTQAESTLKDTVESTLNEISSAKKDLAETFKEEKTEHKYDLYNGLESVEKLVVDVLTADREEVVPKPDEKAVSKKIKDEEQAEGLIEKGVAEVKELVEETKEAVTSLFRRDSKKEEALEKSAEDIEENYEIVSDMAKSVIFEKCDKMTDEEREKQEHQLEQSAQNLEEDYEAVTDMANSIVFEKYEPLTDEQKEERALERSAQDVEENYKIVSDMAQSVVFEKCEKPLTEEEKEETYFEKVGKDLEENYKVMFDMAQSTVFEKCDVSAKEQSTIEEEKVPVAKERVSTETDVKSEKSEDPACKASPETKDVTKEESGKSTPDLRDTDHIKVESQDSLLSGKSSPGLSGKSSPVLSGRSSPGTKPESRDSLLSGKSTPEPTKPDAKEPLISADIKLEEKDKIQPEAKTESKDSLLSGKSTPELTKPDGKESSPDLKLDEKDTLHGEAKAESRDSLLSGKSTPEQAKPAGKESSPSGKSSLDLKLDEKDTLHAEAKAESKDSLLSGKSTPEPAKPDGKESSLSGKSSPALSADTKLEEKDKIQSEAKTESKDSILSGKSTPELTKPDGKESSLSGKSSPALSAELKLDEKDKLHVEAKAESRDSLLSGKSTPEPAKSDGKESSLSGKSSPDLKIDEKDTLHAEAKDSLLSGKSTPELTKPDGKESSLSGKSSPDLKLDEKDTLHVDAKAESKDSLLSGKSTPEPAKPDGKESSPDLKLDAKDTLHAEAKDSLLSGKSTPELTKPDGKESSLSGKSSPDLKLDEKDTLHVDAKAESKDSLLSGKSTPEPAKPDGKESSPDLKLDAKDTLHAEAKDSLLSGKSTPELTKPDGKESSLSGKSSPALSADLKLDEKDKLHVEAKAESKDSLLSGKSTPEPAKPDGKESSLSGKSSPDTKLDDGEAKAERKDSQLSGKSTPELAKPDSKEVKLIEEKVPVPVESGKVPPAPSGDITGSGKTSPVLVSDFKATEEGKSGKSTPELSKDAHVKSAEIGKDLPVPPSDLSVVLKEQKDHVIDKDVIAKSDIPAAIADVKKAEEKQSDPKASLDVEETKEKKLSISDVQISMKDETKVTDKSTSDLSKSETPDDRTDTRDVDSTDSGIGTDMESRLKKSEDKAATEQITKNEEKSVETKDAIAGPSVALALQTSIEDLHLSGKSTPDIAEVEKMKELQEKSHIPGSTTPPTVPVSPIVKDLSSTQPEDSKSATSMTLKSVSTLKDSDLRSCTPGSDDYEIGVSTHSDISSGQVSRAAQLLESERVESDDDDDDVPGSPMSMTSQVAHSRSSSRYDFDDERIGTKMDPMNTSFYGALPDEEDPELDFKKALAEHRQTRGEDLVLAAEDSPSYLYEVTTAKYSAISVKPEVSGQTQLDQINKNGASNLMTASFMGELPTSTTSKDTKDVLDSWGKPLGLPSPAPPTDNRGTPKKERKLPSNVTVKNKLNEKRAESPSKYRNKKLNPVYVDLTYVPHHGNSYYSYVDFFKKVRARYYVFSGIEPSREVYNALLEAKQTWEDKELEVTIIPTYDTDILGYWVAENEELLTKYKIDLSPSASRCTINLQDHETSCSAYRLEF